MACKGNCACKCKKAIVTGVTGQDGSYLAEFLLSKGYKVVGVTRRSSNDNTKRIKHLLNNPKLKIVEADLTDYSSMLNLLHENKDTNELYNLAAQSHVGTSFTQPSLTWDVTAKGCINILQAIVDLGLQKNIRFYQASSSEMFGKNYDQDITGVKLQNENTKFLPQSPYAVAKCAAHYSTRLYREAYGLFACSGILFNHEGPRRGEQFVTRKITKWIGDYVKWKKSLPENTLIVNAVNCEFIDAMKVDGPSRSEQSILSTFPKLRLGNLDVSRDWGFAGDYVQGMWMMLQHGFPDDYVLCTEETHTIKEFLEIAFNHVKITNWKDYVVQDPKFYRPAEVEYLRGDSRKARHLLGWRPQTSFNRLIEMMVENDLNEL